MRMENSREKKRYSGKQMLGMTAGAMVITAAVVLFIVSQVFAPRPFTPVVLSSVEKETLTQKLDRLETGGQGRKSSYPAAQSPGDSGPLVPEPYSEKNADRTIRFSEREINSLLAHNTNLAQRVAVDLAPDLLSIKLLVPVDPDFPVLGGKIIRLKAGAELRYDQKPVIIFRGLSIMGVPMPKAWLGGLKDVDLINEFGSEQGFWKAFADGVESLKIIEGNLEVTLRE